MFIFFFMVLLLIIVGFYDFIIGLLIVDFGFNVEIDVEMFILDGFVFCYSFDFVVEVEVGELNCYLISVVCFFNMYVCVGIFVENMYFVLVVYGVGVYDVVDVVMYVVCYDGVENVNVVLIV